MQNILHYVVESIREDGEGGISAHVYSLADGVIGGALGGAAMVVIAIVYGITSGNGIWYPVNLIAAMVIRQWQDKPAEAFIPFNVGGLVFGAGIHMTIAVIIGVLYVLLLPTLPGHPLIWALIVGPLLWAGALFGLLPLLNPVMARYVDPGSFLSAHLLDNLVLGLWVQRARPIQIDSRVAEPGQ